MIRLRLKGALRLMSVENLSIGIESSASGESLNSGDPTVHPAARHTTQHGLDIGWSAACDREFTICLLYTSDAADE